MKYYSKLLTFLLASSSALSMTLLPSHAMEGQQDKDTPPSNVTRSVVPASPSQDKRTTPFIPGCFLRAAEFDQDRRRITPDHVLNRYLLLRSDLGNHTEEERKDLARAGIRSFMDENYVQAKPSLEKAALYGDTSAMIYLGRIYKREQNPLQAQQWYILAFQTTWENTGKSNLTAIKYLKELNTQEANKFLKQIPPCFLEDEKNPRAIERQQIFYVMAFGHLESYLSGENNPLRAWKLRLQLRRQLKTLGQIFLLAQVGGIYSEDIRFKRAAQLFSEANDPDSLQYLADMLYENKITLRELHGIGALPQPLKRFEAEEGVPLKDLDGAAILWASAKTAPAYHVLGSLLTMEPTIFETLQKIGFFGPFLKERGIDEASYLTPYELAAFLYAQAGAPESLYNLADNLINHKLTLHDLKEKEALSPLLRMLGVKESPSLGDVSLAAHLFESARIPNALNSLGFMLHKEMITVEELGATGALSRLCEYLGIEESSSLTPSTLFALLFVRAGTPESLYNLGLFYLSHGSSLSKEEEIQIAEKCFRASNLGDAKNALAYMYLMGQIEESLDTSTRYQKAFSLLGSAILEGSEKAKELLELAVALFRLEQEKISALEKEESILPLSKGEDLPQLTPVPLPLPETNEQVPTPDLSEEKESSVVPVQAIESGEKEASKDKNKKIVREKENPAEKQKRKHIRILERFGRNLTPIMAEKAKPQNFIIEFADPKVERDYKDRVLLDNSPTSKKIQKLIDYIQNNSSDEKGPGKPKSLQGAYKWKWERRVNGEDRLIYQRYLKERKIIIYSYIGHL